MKFVMLRAAKKETVVRYKDQIAKNDDFYEDSAYSSDYYTVLCDELLKHYDEVEIWYQEDAHHPAFRAFVHGSGLVERYWPKKYEGLTKGDEPAVLFVRGDMPDYHAVLGKFKDTFKVYYSAGHYYLPPARFKWSLVFVDDPRHVKEAREVADCPVELFKKSCVSKFFPGSKGKGAVDIYFTCNAPQFKIKGLRFFLRIMTELKSVSALCVGLKNMGMEEEFRGLPVHFTGFISRRWVGQLMARSKMGLVLSGKDDGSPRVLQEYICSDLPVVVREETTHSPFYVNSETGIASADDNMVRTVLDTLRNREVFSPRKYFMENLTIKKSAEHLIDCIGKHNSPVPEL